MIVITIVGIFYAATAGFDWRPQTDMEKSDRMVVAISSTIRTETQNMSIGKMPRNNGYVSKMTVITIWTGGMLTSYSWSNGMIWSGTFVNPYFDGDSKYAIKSVIWTGSSTVAGGTSWTGEIIIAPTGIVFSGAGITWSWFTLLEIKVGYNVFTRKIVFDRRTGKISETKR